MNPWLWIMCLLEEAETEPQDQAACVKVTEQQPWETTIFCLGSYLVSSKISKFLLFSISCITSWRYLRGWSWKDWESLKCAWLTRSGLSHYLCVYLCGLSDPSWMENILVVPSYLDFRREYNNGDMLLFYVVFAQECLWIFLALRIFSVEINEKLSHTWNLLATYSAFSKHFYELLLGKTLPMSHSWPLFGNCP